MCGILCLLTLVRLAHSVTFLFNKRCLGLLFYPEKKLFAFFEHSSSQIRIFLIDGVAENSLLLLVLTIWNHEGASLKEASTPSETFIPNLRGPQIATFAF